MRKWLVLAGVVFAAVALVAVAVANLDRYLNQNKGWIEEQAAASLGRSVALDRVGISLWPHLAIDIIGLRVAGDPRYSTSNLVDIAEVRIRVNLLSAVFGDVNVSGVVLRRPVLSVVQTAGGLNLASLGVQDPSHSAASSDSSDKSSAALAAVIALLEVEDGEIRYLDRRREPPVELRMEHVAFEAENVGFIDPIRFELAASVLAPGAAQNLRLEGSVGPVVVGEPLQTPVELRLHASLSGSERLAAAVNLVAPGASLVGEVTLVASLGGTLEELTVEVALDARQAAVHYGDAFAKPRGVPLRLALSARVAGERVDIADGELSVADATFRYRGRVELESLAYELELDSDPIDLSGRETLLPALSGLGLAGRAALDVAVSGAASSPGLPRLEGTVLLSDLALRPPDQLALTGLSGSLSFRDGGVFLAPSPLAIDAAQGLVSLRIDDLDEVVAKLNFTAQAGQFQGIDYDALNADATYISAKSMLTIDRLELAAYGGELAATGSFDASDPEFPEFAFEARVAALGLEEVVSTLFGPAASPLEGQVGGELRLTGVGTDRSSLESSLTGDGVLRLDDVVLQDVNLADDLLGKMSAVPGLNLRIPQTLATQFPAVFGGSETRFESVRGQLRVHDGRVSVDDLRVVADHYVMTVAGSIFLDGQVDLRGSFLASPALSRGLISEVKALRYLRGPDRGIRIPFQMTGGLAQGLRVEPDVQSMAKTVAPALVGDLLGRLAGKTWNRKHDGEGEEVPDREEASAQTPEESQIDPGVAAAEALLRNLFRKR